ncbi:hypothetical protein [Streptomyces cacaoi]|uniref:hypothetical protein n=1 Tax=Streptomyces cacaoi TaxID=1898 RepID=UPI00261C3BE1|nr:hypothetical protein [Streptomyces cacaoi]
MTPQPDPVPALLAHLADTPDAWLLTADRRPTGRALPTVPVPDATAGPGGLDQDQAAAALFEIEADQLARVPEQLPTDTLTAALSGSVNRLGMWGLCESTETFTGLEADQFPEVGVCRWLAYRLTLTFWYEGAHSRPMTAGEVAACLYASTDPWDDSRPLTPTRLREALHEGTDALDGPRVQEAGTLLTADAAPSRRQPRRPLPAPWTDPKRRARCFHLARHYTATLDTPLMVHPTESAQVGPVLLGATVPSPVRQGAHRPLVWRW